MAALVNQKTYLNKERLWRLFKVFDTDDKNYITISDVKSAFSREGILFLFINILGRLLSDKKL